jgi:hypothetical protein
MFPQRRADDIAEGRYASWLRRGVGFVIDLALLIVLELATGRWSFGVPRDSTIGLVDFGLWLMYGAFALALFRRTLGMKVVKIHLAPEAGHQRVRLPQVLVRTIVLAGVFSWFLVDASMKIATAHWSLKRETGVAHICEFLLLGAIVAFIKPLWDPRRRTLQDEVAHTVVVRT